MHVYLFFLAGAVAFTFGLAVAARWVTGLDMWEEKAAYIARRGEWSLGATPRPVYDRRVTVRIHGENFKFLDDSMDATIVERRGRFGAAGSRAAG